MGADLEGSEVEEEPEMELEDTHRSQGFMEVHSSFPTISLLLLIRFASHSSSHWSSRAGLLVLFLLFSSIYLLEEA